MNTGLFTSLISLVLVCVPVDAISAESKKHVGLWDVVSHTMPVMSKAWKTCADWKITGVCFWLKCDLAGCRIKSSIKVKHFNPDALVQVYDSPERMAIRELSVISRINKKAGSMMARRLKLKQPVELAGAGFSTVNRGTGKSSTGYLSSINSISKNVDVVGSPVAPIFFRMLGDASLACDTGVTPFMPYYSSFIDFLHWSNVFPVITLPLEFLFNLPSGSDFSSLSALNELLKSRPVTERSDGQKKPSKDAQRFESLFPRDATVVQTHDYKAAAVVAQRAADIATEEGVSFRARLPMGHTKKKKWYSPPERIKEWDSKTGKWQMLYPNMDKTCHIISDIALKDTTPTTLKKSDIEIPDAYKSRRSDYGYYAWQLWRPYECCKKRSGKFLMTVDFN